MSPEEQSHPPDDKPPVTPDSQNNPSPAPNEQPEVQLPKLSPVDEAVKTPKKLEDLRFSIEEKPSNRVFFISSGSDEKMKQTVLDFLQSLGVEVVYLKEGPNAAKPLIEKINAFRDITVLVGVFSPDEFAYPKNGKPGQAVMQVQQKIGFELGFWIGKLGRDRVLTIHYDQKSFRMPSEFFDAKYTPFDKPGLWKNELKAHLEKNGINISKK